MIATLLIVVMGAGAYVAYREISRTRHRASRAEDMTVQLVEANRRLESLVADHERTRAALAASEEQVRQAQKMEAVGRLAGGVAHDFNNILTAITAYADFLIEAIPANDPRGDDAREIRRAAKRATTLTSQLLAFSRRQVHQPRPINLNEVVSEFSKILGRVIGEDVRLEMQLWEGLGTIKADPSQVEQVIMNLVVNASDAMPQGGSITISTHNVDIVDAEHRPHPSLRLGSYAVLRVTDTGMGMDDATIQHIFDPFFTTKESGKGTGLGLATVYAITERSGGVVTVRSAPREGAEFSIYLPRIDAAAEHYASGANLPLPPRGTETLLLVEDDDAVRVLSARILERHGYTVLIARDGKEALDQARRHTSDIDLLITDVVMPRIGGKRLSDILSAQRPEIRVIFQSGYTAGEIDRRGELDPSIAFLQKPFSAQALLLKVREVLDSAVP
ncbi:MAG TPA: ATP-binding protein, partial [Gemmatimonadaceae bacterium]|nr:ATP-binding protein [Gemmatimonadaceae bacterium]